MKISLKAARVNKKLTQKKVAALMGISIETVGKWERGITFPDVKQLNKLIEIYGISFENLFF